MKEITFRDMIGDGRIEDRGAMPKEFYRKMTIKCYDCQDRPMDITLNPNDTYDIRGCKGKTISWEGKLKWDGRRITGTERRGVFDLFRR